MEEEDRKRYQFSQDGVIGEDRRKAGGCNRERGCWVLVSLILIAALVAVSVYFTQNYSMDVEAPMAPEKQTGGMGTTGGPDVTTEMLKSTSASSFLTTVPPHSELLKRKDCIPEAQGNVSMATEELCAKRFCLYEDTKEVGIPVCYMSPKLGYRVIEISKIDHGLRVDLEIKADGPFGWDLRTAVFYVHMLGNDLIRFQVRFYSV